MSLVLLRRYRQLMALIPELFDPKNAGTLLYVGACPQRCHYSTELYKIGHKITVLEIWPEAVEGLKKTRWWGNFEHVICGDVRKVAEIELPYAKYDYIFWWHGPEHIDCSEFPDTVQGLESITTQLVVMGSPWGIAPGGIAYGNDANRHRSYLYYEDYARLRYEVAALGPKNRGGSNLLAWKWIKK